MFSEQSHPVSYIICTLATWLREWHIWFFFPWESTAPPFPIPYLPFFGWKFLRAAWRVEENLSPQNSHRSLNPVVLVVTAGGLGVLVVTVDGKSWWRVDLIVQQRAGSGRRSSGRGSRGFPQRVVLEGWLIIWIQVLPGYSFCFLAYHVIAPPYLPWTASRDGGQWATCKL